MLCLQHMALTCPGEHHLKGLALRATPAGDSAAVVSLGAIFNLACPGTSMWQSLSHLSKYEIYTLLKWLIVKSLFSIVAVVTCLRDVQPNCKFNRSFIPLTAQILKEAFCFPPPPCLYLNWKIFLIHIIADKVSILQSKYLGEGRETWFWVSEVAGTALLQPTAWLLSSLGEHHLPWRAGPTGKHCRTTKLELKC